MIGAYVQHHGDLRPKNILLDKKNKRLLLLSPGTAHTTPPGSDKKISMVSDGNRSYLASELFAGKPASTASDIYAVGVMLYRFLTGKFPYGKVEPNRRDWGEFISPTRYRADIPPWLIAVLQKACAPDPAGRYSSAADFAQALTEDRKPNTERKKTALTAARHIQKPWELYAAVALTAGMLVYMAIMLV